MVVVVVVAVQMVWRYITLKLEEDHTEPPIDSMKRENIKVKLHRRRQQQYYSDSSVVCVHVSDSGQCAPPSASVVWWLSSAVRSVSFPSLFSLPSSPPFNQLRAHHRPTAFWAVISRGAFACGLGAKRQEER